MKTKRTKHDPQFKANERWDSDVGWWAGGEASSRLTAWR